MDFFGFQDRARRSTKLLMVYFGAGVVLLTEAQCHLEHVGAALNRLTLAVPQIKKNSVRPNRGR